MEVAGNQGAYTRSERFEIDEVEFHRIRIDENRIMAAGPSWSRFELLLSFIGAAWMERWRRFGLKFLATGCFVFLFGLLGFYTLFGLLLMGTGGILILLWFFVRREAILLYTPGAKFKIEGSSDFIERLWTEISKAQRRRQI